MTEHNAQKTNGPKSIGIIMDGNRRWAKENNMSAMEGHRFGLEKVREVIGWSKEAGIREVILYAFSTENWNRAAAEVEYLMALFEYSFNKWMKELAEEGMQIRFIGDRTRAPEKVLKIMKEVEEQTAAGTEGTFVVAFSYGGRAEILAAVNVLLAKGKNNVTEEEFRNAMWSKGLSDPDLIIRTSGEKRLSNFLTWQAVYSELFFTDTKWPGFSKEEFDSILAEFAKRERRHGK
jgi:undecaprenyl diphosphate synthase